MTDTALPLIFEPNRTGSLPSLDYVHTSKRGRNERSGVHAWHPYYAGYAERFVADVLATLACPGDTVLDPWNGSGTTTFVAQRAGYDAIGIEINPVMALHAAAKDAWFVRIADHLLQDAERIINVATSYSVTDGSADAAILDFVATGALRAIRALQRAVSEVCAVPDLPEWVAALCPTGSRLHGAHSVDRAAFFNSAVFQVLRQVGTFKQGSNPTWLAVRPGNTNASEATVFEAFGTTVRSMLQTLERTTPAKARIGKSAILNGDSRRLPFRDACIDLAITSPPYCTRIDYAVSTKPELMLWGGETGYDRVRRSTMGAPVIVDKELVPVPEWGMACNQLLAAVPEHESKAARSYYLPNFLQYFRDAYDSLRELGRVLKPGGYAAIVVQSSYFKEIEIPLGEIYVQMAHALGLCARIARRETVRQHMAHINTKSRKYLDTKVYYEDVVLVRRG